MFRGDALITKNPGTLKKYKIAYQYFPVIK